MQITGIALSEYSRFSDFHYNIMYYLNGRRSFVNTLNPSPHGDSHRQRNKRSILSSVQLHVITIISSPYYYYITTLTTRYECNNSAVHKYTDDRCVAETVIKVEAGGGMVAGYFGVLQQWSNLGVWVTRREAAHSHEIRLTRHNAIQFKTHNIIYRKLYGFKLID